MAVRSCAEGGAGAPCGHRITGDPTRGCRGGAGRGLRLGAGERAMIATGLAQGDSAALIARRIGRCRQTVSGEIRRGAGVGRGLPPGGGAGRGPGALGPPQDPQAGRQSGPARAGRRPARGIGSVPGRSPPVCGSRTPMMGACASVTSRSTQGPGCVQGAGSLRAQLRVEGALRTGRTRRTPALPTGRRSPSPGARAGYRGATHRSAPAPGRRGGRPRALGGRPDHRRRPPAAP